MKLKYETFKGLLKNIRAIYGPSWRSDIEKDKEVELQFFKNCQELIPDELADVFVTVYRTRRARAPYSPYDILESYIEKQLENAKSSEFVIDKLIAAIRNYDQVCREQELPFADCDDYLFQNVIPMLPCFDGVKAFYIRNKRSLRHLALNSPDEYEKTPIYNRLGRDYSEQLTIVERKAVIRRINSNGLADGKNRMHQLEA